VLPVVFSQAARTEVLEAQAWYARQAPGLAARFRDELAAGVARLQSNPLQSPVVFKQVRRARLRKFPYALFFCVQADALFVIACFHSSRDPVQWQRRL
jgi:plasmid stabilization system protein ParE